jgi:ElaA protein
MKIERLNWQCCFFNDLKAAELYAILQLRNEVFVVEQNCVFQDADNKDPFCYHLCGWDDETLVAYTRLVPPGIAYKEPSIGRVVISPGYRNTGAGKALMQNSIEQCKKLFDNKPIKLGAQLYLKKFYESFGFEQNSEVYLEDNIPHIEMILMVA